MRSKPACSEYEHECMRVPNGTVKRFFDNYRKYEPDKQKGNCYQATGRNRLGNDVNANNSSNGCEYKSVQNVFAGRAALTPSVDDRAKKKRNNA